MTSPLDFGSLNVFLYPDEPTAPAEKIGPPFPILAYEITNHGAEHSQFFPW